MPDIQKKAGNIVLKDTKDSTRRVVFEYATFGNLDRDEDISCKGMTTKTVADSFGDVLFLLNHDRAAGKPVELWEEKNAAVADCECGTHTTGNDAYLMLKEGVIRFSSFGFETLKSEKIPGKKGKKIQEIKLWEVSVLEKWPANPMNRIIATPKHMKDMSNTILTKSLSTAEQDIFLEIVQTDNQTIQRLVELWLGVDKNSDLYSWLGYYIRERISIAQTIRSELKWNPAEAATIKEHIITMEKFCHNTTASDDCITTVQQEIKDAKLFLLNLDTAYTGVASQPSASELKELSDVFDTFNNKLKSQTWN